MTENPRVRFLRRWQHESSKRPSRQRSSAADRQHAWRRSDDFTSAVKLLIERSGGRTLWAAHGRARKGRRLDDGRTETINATDTAGRNIVDSKGLVPHKDIELPDLCRFLHRLVFVRAANTASTSTSWRCALSTSAGSYLAYHHKSSRHSCSAFVAAVILAAKSYAVAECHAPCRMCNVERSLGP
jgi:hypothetical protein